MSKRGRLSRFAVTATGRLSWFDGCLVATGGDGTAGERLGEGVVTCLGWIARREACRAGVVTSDVLKTCETQCICTFCACHTPQVHFSAGRVQHSVASSVQLSTLSSPLCAQILRHILQFTQASGVSCFVFASIVSQEKLRTSAPRRNRVHFSAASLGCPRHT